MIQLKLVQKLTTKTSFQEKIREIEYEHGIP